MTATTSTLITSRLSLVRFPERLIADHYLKWLLDAEVMRFSEQRHSKHTLETCAAYVSSFDHVHNHLWAIMLGTQHVGNVSAHRDLPNRTADIGILIGEKSAWGQGLGAEAYSAVTQWLLRNGCRQVTAGAMEANRGMIRVLERSGFTIDGVRPGYFLLEGAPTGMVFASINGVC